MNPVSGHMYCSSTNDCLGSGVIAKFDSTINENTVTFNKGYLDGDTTNPFVFRKRKWSVSNFLVLHFVLNDSHAIIKLAERDNQMNWEKCL